MIILNATCLCCHNDWKMWKMKKCEMQKQSRVCSRRGILPLRSSASTAATGWDRRGKLLSQRSAQNNHIWCIGAFAFLIAVFCFVLFTFCLHFLSTAAVYCERLGGGEDGGDPEEEAGPVGEGLRLHEQREEDITDQWRQTAAGAVWRLRMSVIASSRL